MPLQASDGTVSNPSITTSGDTNTGIYFPAADTIGLVEGGTEVVRINSSGNVGIGILNPTSTLTVSGTTSISGNTTVTSSTGSTSTTTGALVVTGGIGVGGSLNVGSEINGVSILSGSKLLGTSSTTITITFGDYSWANISIYQNNTSAVNARAYKLNAGRRDSSISQNIVWQVQNDATAVWSGDNLVITIPHIPTSGNTSKFCTAIGRKISNLTVV